MNEHGVKESRTKMLVMESNKIDQEKQQCVFFSLVAKEGFEPSCSLENLFGFMVRSSAGCNEIDIDGSSSGNPGCEVDSS